MDSLHFADFPLYDSRVPQIGHLLVQDLSLSLDHQIIKPGQLVIMAHSKSFTGLPHILQMYSVTLHLICVTHFDHQLLHPVVKLLNQALIHSFEH